MTRACRAGILVAFFAALLGAPSAVLGAPPNRLSARPPAGPAAASTHEHADAGAGPAKAASGRGGSAPAAPVDPARGATASDSPDTAASPPPGSHSSPAPDLAAAPVIGSDSRWTVTALAVFGVATLGILAIAWMLLGRRRRGDDGQPLAATGALQLKAVPRGGTRRETEHGGAPTTEQLLGRAARQSRLDPSDDPIVAAMGLSPRADATPRYSAGQLNPDPDERLVAKGKRRRRS